MLQTFLRRNDALSQMEGNYMCDAGPLQKLLVAIAAANVAASAITIAGGIANGAFCCTYVSALGMLSAVTTSTADYLCGQALSALDTLRTSTGPTCATQCSNFLNTLTAAFVVHGLQITVCLVVAVYASIPGVANPAQWIIIGAFIIEAVLIQELSSETQFIHYSE